MSVPDLSLLALSTGPKAGKQSAGNAVRKAKASPYPRIQTPGATETDPDIVDYQSILKQEGLVVVPTPLTDPALRQQVRQGFFQHIRESPEFRNPTPEDPEWKPVLGGFAAMANPSSFHHPWVRKLREMITAAILDTDAIPAEGRRIERTFDRLLYRIPGEQPSAESMHRDEAKTALDGDTVFGGWVNFDDEPQFFSCCPRTHQDVGGQNKGFAKIDKNEYEMYRNPAPGRPQGWVVVEIPPGTGMLFYERLVHEVNPAKATRLMMRMAMGWRVTDATEPLFANEMDKWINDQGVPRIKSGQAPPVWPKAYSNFPRNFPTLTNWAKRTFVDKCLFLSNPVASGAAQGTQWIRVEANMLSLREYGLPMFPAYDTHEWRLLRPQRTWQLYTFGSPNKRVTYNAVSESDWRAYVAAQHAVPLGVTVRRPRPEAKDKDVVFP